MTIPEPILIRFDGMDADDHRIEMSALADSLKGLSRIIGVTANFAATERYSRTQDQFEIRVVVEPPQAHCFELSVVWEWLNGPPLVTGITVVLFTTLIGYVFKSAVGNAQEMRHLKDSLDKAIEALGVRDQAQIDRMMTTIEKMANSLRPAAKQAVAPIGRTASKLTIGSASDPRAVVLTEVERDQILASVEAEIEPAREYEVLLFEMDMRSGACHVSFASDPDGRIEAKISDPVFSSPNNPYVSAMADQTFLKVRGKSAVRDGEIVKLYISDTV